MQTFSNSDQMKSFMKKEAQRLNISISSAYTTYVARCMLYRISKYNMEDMLIKGSSAEISYMGKLVRTIIDIDVATLKTLEDNYDLFINMFEDEFADCLKIDFSKAPYKTKTGIYKFGFNVSFDKICQPIGMDLQENYNRLIEPEYRVMPVIFEGDEPFEIYVPSFEEYLAEKLCIIVESNKENVLNTRVKDFYDIYQLHGGNYDYDKLTEYFQKMIKLRNKIDIKDAKTLNLNKDFIDKHQDIWESTSKRYDFLDKEIDLSGAVYYTRGVIREQLQKSGQEMEDNLDFQKIKK